MKGSLCIILLIFYTGLLKGQTPDSCKVTLSLSNVPLQKVLETLSGKYNLAFSYQSNLPDLQTRVNISATDLPLSRLLGSALTNTVLLFKFFGKQVIIYQRTEVLPQTMLIEGRLYKKDTKEPIAFAGLELKIAHKGTISDMQGYFRIEISPQTTDTLLISSLNYHPLRVPLKNLMLPGLHTLYMSERAYDLPSIEIRGEKQKFERMGNLKWRSSGSFYLDTHGQQTALFIPNEARDSGNLITASVYLSKRGNTDAPFRIHVYAPDIVTGKPGIELLPEMVIVKPTSGKGWYKVNLSRYRISLPQNGIYIAIEGIFPGDYDFLYDDASQTTSQDENDGADDFEGETISYGQQIGYTGGSTNNTWHYSIDRTWFQLKKKHFNAMIFAEFKIAKTKGGKGFLGLFGRRKNLKT